MVLLTILNLNLNLNLKSQVAVNTSGNAADASSMLDVSSSDKGILIPRMTESERDGISDAIEGLLIYQTNNTPGFYFYNGTAWVVVGDGATSINSLYDGKTNSYNLFIGSGTGFADNNGLNRNTAVGINAYHSSVNGYANTAFGNEALKLTTEGTHNAAFGTQALTSNLTGVENTALGTNAGFSVTGSGNVLIGANVAFSQTDISNQLFIDNSNTNTPLIYGDFITNLLRINGTLDINNSYQLPTSDGTVGQTLKTDGSGSLTWSDDTNTGATNIDGLSDGLSDGNSLYMGAEAGNLAGSNKFSTGVGVWSLKNVTTGANNTALGTSSLMSLSEGSNNTVVGTNTLQSITITSNNTVLGTTAGQSVIGDGNVFIGNEVAKTQTNISNKLFIDNSDTVAPLIYGEFDSGKVRVNGNFEISGTLKIEGSTPGNGKVLGSDLDGNSSWIILTSSLVGLGNVENTALSTWTGSTNITTLGSINYGEWQGSTIGDSFIGDLSASKITSGVFSNDRINWASPGYIGEVTPGDGYFSNIKVYSSLYAEYFKISTDSLDFFKVQADSCLSAGSATFEKVSTEKFIFPGGAGEDKVFTSNNDGTGNWKVQPGIRSDERGLKLIRGAVSADGSIISGTGFSVSKLGTGEYSINITDDFDLIPTVTVSMLNTDFGSSNRIIPYVNNIYKNSCKIETVDVIASGFAEGIGFEFIAVGIK